MSLSLIVEDGTGVANANSYATLAQIRAYNAQRGVTLPDDDDACIELASVAMDYLESYEPRWQGERTQPLLQFLSWPRACVFLYGQAYTSINIPTRVINAQCYLTGISQTVDLNSIQDTRAITKEVIGPLETDYSTSAGASINPIIPLLDSVLAPLLKSGSGIIKSVRV